MAQPEARLERLVRLREAQRSIALSNFAARSAAAARHQALAARIAGILDATQMEDIRAADGLARLLTFRSGVAELARAAAEQAAQGGRQALAARQALAGADRKLDRAGERRDDARRAMTERRAG